MYRIAESPYRTPKTNTILYVNDTGIKFWMKIANDNISNISAQYQIVHKESQLHFKKVPAGMEVI